tara:strand:- start:111 stop:725 length:615 start_codon:yes stop_codon:yes gene_type:complete
MLKKGILYLFFTASTITLAQTTNDSIQTESLVVKKKEKTPRNPFKASILSAIIPGSGQIYNGKWWKAPIVWGGFATAIIVHDFYYDKHAFYHQILIYKDLEIDEVTIAAYADENGSRFTKKSGTDISKHTQSRIQTFNDDAEKRKQQVYLMTTLFYILQIVDASVDAHFSTFDVSDDLSLQIRPTIFKNKTSFSAGINFKFSLL